jgi:hypothetical protein
MGVGGQSHAPVALPPGKTWYPLYRGLGGPQARSGRERKISPPPGWSQDRPVRSESLYRLSYPSPHQKFIQMFKYQVPTSHKTNYFCITKTNSQYSLQEESLFFVTTLRHKQGHCAGKMRILIQIKAGDTQFISAGRGRTSTHRPVHVRTWGLRTEICSVRRKLR